MNTIDLDERGVTAPCPNCNTRNRLAYEQLGEAFRCGNCHTGLRPPGQALPVPSESVFDALINLSALPVLVDFWAPWCGPCKMAAPEFEKVAADGVGLWLVAKVNAEELPHLAERFHITSIPTFALFQGGHEIARESGALPAATLRRFIQQNQTAGVPHENKR